MMVMDAALVCKSLSDGTRLQILQMLAAGEQCACKLLEAFSITQPTLSYHMKKLVESGLVKVRKAGKWNYYSIDCRTLQAFKAFVANLSCSEQGESCSCS